MFSDQTQDLWLNVLLQMHYPQRLSESKSQFTSLAVTGHGTTVYRLWTNPARPHPHLTDDHGKTSHNLPGPFFR